MMADEKLYFAYNDNIYFRQMDMCCPARAVGAVALDGYELLFRGSANVGVATIVPKEGSTVYGALWKIPSDHEQDLERQENQPYWYKKEQVTVRNTRGQEFTAITYVMESNREPALPSSRYFAIMRAGYRWFKLPYRDLKQAWDHAVQEVYEQTERAYAEISKPDWRCKRRNDYER